MTIQDDVESVQESWICLYHVRKDGLKYYTWAPGIQQSWRKFSSFVEKLEVDKEFIGTVSDASFYIRFQILHRHEQNFVFQLKEKEI